MDLAGGPRYIEPIRDYEESDDDLDQIYKITARDQDWANLRANGRIAWDRESSCTSYSNEELKQWQNRLHEVSTLHCNMMIKSLCCVSSEVRSFPYYDGITDVDKFLDAFEREVPEKHCFQALDLALCATPPRQCGMHKNSFDGWREYRKMMRLRFGHPKIWLTEKYDGRNYLHDHLAKWTNVWDGAAI